MSADDAKPTSKRPRDAKGRFAPRTDRDRKNDRDQKSHDDSAKSPAERSDAKSTTASNNQRDAKK